MSKKITTLLILFFLLIATAPIAYATESDDYNDIYQASGASELGEYLPEGINDLMLSTGIIDHDGKISEPDIGKLFGTIFSTLKEESSEPIKNALVIIGIIVLLSYFGGIKNTLDSSETTETAYMIAETVCVIVLVKPVISFLGTAANAVTAANVFEKGFIPVFCGILMFGGQQMTSAGSAVKMLTVSEISDQIICSVVIPLSKGMFAMSIAGGLQIVDIYSIIESVQKAVKWILGILGTVASAVLSLSGIVTASADSVANKTAKFVVSGTVPIIGGAVGDALTSIRGCVAVMKSSVGSFGIIACAFIFIPVLARGGAWIFTFEICSGIAKSIGVDGMYKLLKTFSGIISIIIAAVVLLIMILAVTASTIMVTGRS